MVRNKTDDDDACDVLTCCTLKPLNSLYPIRKLHHPQGRVGPGGIKDRKPKQSPDQRTGGRRPPVKYLKNFKAAQRSEITPSNIYGFLNSKFTKPLKEGITLE